uniref:Uncharacterized protein n=1 Tax=Gossypium raimondii TaxID=29730 RepID=A0A0D2R277_GOSRA|nr:hypothetical protein B456_010G050300 [Gossypium raimondii]
MEKSVFVKDVQQLNGNLHHSFSSVSQRDVTYRNTATIGSKYGKLIKRGMISFFNIDETRFTQVDEFQCRPYFSKHSWGLFRHRTKLLCRKCGNHIGDAYDDKSSGYPHVLDGSDSSSGTEPSNHRKYDVRIRALQPSTAEGLGSPLFA